MPEKEGKVAVKNQYWNSRRGGADRAWGTIQKMKEYFPHHCHRSTFHGGQWLWKKCATTIIEQSNVWQTSLCSSDIEQKMPAT